MKVGGGGEGGKGSEESWWEALGAAVAPVGLAAFGEKWGGGAYYYM